MRVSIHAGFVIRPELFHLIQIYLTAASYFYSTTRIAGNQHEYCKPSDSDSIQTANNKRITENRQPKQQHTDHKQVPSNSQNGQTNPTETHIVPRPASAYSKNHKNKKFLQKSSTAIATPSPDKSIGGSGIAPKTAISNRSTDTSSVNSQRQAHPIADQQETVSIPETHSTVAESRSIAQIETNNHNNNNILNSDNFNNNSEISKNSNSKSDNNCNITGLV